MGVLWVVFLTCGLLTSSQGLPGSASVSARVNKDVLESGKCLEEAGLIFILRPLRLFLSLDHAQKIRIWLRSVQAAVTMLVMCIYIAL